MPESGSPVLFSVHTERRNGVSRIALLGELDLSTAPAFREHLVLADGKDGRGIILDVRDVTFIDSTGLRAVLDAAREALDRGSLLAVVGASTSVRKIFELTGTEVYLNDGEALGLMQRFSGPQGEAGVG